MVDKAASDALLAGVVFVGCERVVRSRSEGLKFGPMALDEYRAIEVLYRAVFGSDEPWLPTDVNMAKSYVFHHGDRHA